MIKVMSAEKAYILVTRTSDVQTVREGGLGNVVEVVGFAVVVDYEPPPDRRS